MTNRSLTGALTITAAVTLLLAAGCSSSSSPEASTSSADASSANASSAAEQSSNTANVSVAYTALTVTNLGNPTFPFRGSDGQDHVAYALQLTNAGLAPATLERVDVVDAADPTRTLASFSGPDLVDPSCGYGACNRLRTLPSSPAPNADIESGQSRALLVDFTLAPGTTAPKSVLHKVTALASATPGPGAPTQVEYLVTPKDVAARTALVISPPLRGDNWVAQNGCCEIGFPHVMSLLPLSGQLADSQRFAIDWMRLDDQGRFYDGDRTKNESYQNYGQEIHAVADGTISATLDEVEANAPGILPATVPALAAKLTVNNVDGNHIVQDLGDGTWAMYAHLQKGSLLVKPGDKVTKGQVIAKLGNTGNSNAPHLHFQLMDGPNLIGSDGIPYVFDSFDYAGYIDPAAIIAADDYLTGEFFAHHAAPEARTKQLPLNDSIVNFGG
ncbi:M23 family metallopeptidase [Tomitella biformata]|uniref:M23 family metallopeptidase n=1 Tax=Tomitella biformata TaxID=630403 RepID=UPI0004665C1C|nr:M23 family metallopeptidase [Tomitella biformata]